MNKQKIKKFYGFTLVELIIVITILAILATVAFASFQNYTSQTRDTSRISSLLVIEKGLDLNYIITSKYPIPDNKITISSSGVTINYQGNIGNNISNLLSLGKIPTDPGDNSNYLYSVNYNQNSYKILAFGETNKLVLNNVYASDNSSKYYITKGFLPFLLNSDNTLISTNIDLFLNGSGSSYNQINNSNSIIIGSGIDLLGGIQNLSKTDTNYSAPKGCPDGYIPVKGSPDFSQPGFCIAKYEMSFDGINNPDSYTGGIEWNSVSYKLHSGSLIASKSGDYPIGEISQSQAIKECSNIGGHLVTNNEWMTIARQIENNSKNWSSGIVGSGFVYNGVSNHTNGCSGMTYQIYPSLVYSFGTKTGDWDNSNQRAKDCNKVRQLYLENQEIIRDFAGNLWEHVNKKNTLNGSLNDYGTSSVLGVSDLISWDDNGIFDKNELNKNFSLLGNFVNNGVGNVFYGGGKSYNVFLRGGCAYTSPNVGIYTLELDWRTNDFLGKTGFRCAY